MTQASQRSNGRFCQSLIQVADSLDTGESPMSREEVPEMLTQILLDPELFEEAKDDLQVAHFNPAAELDLAEVWAAALHLHDQAGATPPVEAVRNELIRRIQEAPPLLDVASPTDVESTLSEGGLLDRILAREADSPRPDYGRSLVRRFLIERTCTEPLARIGRAATDPMQPDSRIPRDFIERACQAVEEADEIDEKWGAGRQRMRFISACEFAETNYPLSWHVPGVFVAGQPAIVGGPSKAMKTSVMLDMAVSLASPNGGRFLGHFPVEPARVIFISAESGESTIKETVERICRSKLGTTLASLRMTFCFEAPRLNNPGDMAAIRKQIRDQQANIVFFDPLYLMLLSGTTEVSAANLYQMGPLLREVARVCLDAGATPVLIHHFTKPGAMSHEPASLANLAFAGVGEFARQWMLVNRRESFVPGSGIHRLNIVTGGSVGFSTALAVDIDEGYLREDFTGRRWSVTVNSLEDARLADRDAQQEQNERERQEADAEVADCIVEFLRTQPHGGVSSQIRTGVGVSIGKCDRAVQILLNEGRIEAVQVRRTNSQSYDGYRLVSRDQGVETS